MVTIVDYGSGNLRSVQKAFERLGAEARFPGLDYVVFPGNVGGDTALADAVGKFGSPSPP